MLTVGQKLWFVPSYNVRPYEVEIKKIGRKWAHTERNFQTLRIDIETMRPHENDGSGQCYLSQQHYEDYQAREKAWREFTSAVDKQKWRCPDGVTVEKIMEIRNLLGI